MPLDLDELERLHEAATPEPWKWVVNLSARSISIESKCFLVMGFTRWGMDGAQPQFRRRYEMVKASELTVSVEGREHHERWFRALNHPDAAVTTAARNALPALLRLARRARRLEEAARELIAADDGYDLDGVVEARNALRDALAEGEE